MSGERLQDHLSSGSYFCSKHRGGSNGNQYLCFIAKIMYTPVNPSFTI